MTDERTDIVEVIITDYDEAKEVYRHKDMRQALYDEGVVMTDVLVNLHGEAHRARRRLENRLFRYDVLEHYERQRFPAVIDATLAPHVAAGRAELVRLSHELMMNLAAVNAGIDRPEGSAAETLRLYGYMMTFIAGATIAHSTRDHAEVNAEVAEAMARFDAEFLAPSIARRRPLVGTPDEPLDVLSVLLANADGLELPGDVVLREIAFFLLAGAHTSATAYTRSLHEVLQWIAAHPEDAERVRRDRLFVQRCVHETVRLNPSSPVARRWALSEATLRTGRVIPSGARVTVDLTALNRDPAIFGARPEAFDPYRVIERPDVGPYGLSFGHGMHHCIGQELAAGSLAPAGDDLDRHLYGLATVAVQATLDRGVALDPDDPAVMDANTVRPYWARYPVRFG